jgi:predicted CoA-binding protein
MSNSPDYPDAKIRGILQRVRTIAMVGASANPARPSFGVMRYLQGKGYRVIPVNPGLAGQDLQGERVHAALRDIPEPVDMVDIFRATDAVPGIVEEAIAMEVIMNRCPAIEIERLGRPD